MLSKDIRAMKALRKRHKGKGILYNEFAGIYGNPLNNSDEHIEDYIIEDAVEAGFLPKPDQTSLFGNIKRFELHITDEHHTYYDAVKHAIGYPVEYIELMIGPESAKLMFHGGKFSPTKGVVFNMIDGIYNFINTLIVVDSHGWNPEDYEEIKPGTLLEEYSQQYYYWIAKH